MTRLIRYLVVAQKVIIVSSQLMIVATFGAVVVLRYGFAMNLFAYEELVLVAAFALYFIGAAQGSYDDTHIKADLIQEWIRSDRARKRYRLAIHACEAVIGAVLSYWGYEMMAAELAGFPQMSATPVYRIPLAVPRGLIFLGFVLMTLYAAMHLVRVWRQPVDHLTTQQEKS